MIALFIVLGIILLVFIICLILYFMAYYNEKKGTPKDMEPLGGLLYVPFKEKSKTLIAKSDSIPFEVKELKIKKNFTLRAKYYFKHENAPLAIMVHGYKGCGIRDFSGGLVEVLNRGCNVLLIDHRGHGISDGRSIGFGVKEKYDVIRWINYANKEFNNPDIYLYGISMGAATVLMVSGMDIPSNVKCVVADCPFSSVKQILKDTVKKMKVPFFLAYPFLYLSALIFVHFNISNGEVKNYVKKSKIPLMIIHGTTDDIVPVGHSRKLVNEFKDKIHYVEVEGAPHGMSYFVDYERYGDELTKFLNNLA